MSENNITTQVACLGSVTIPVSTITDYERRLAELVAYNNRLDSENNRLENRIDELKEKEEEESPKIKIIVAKETTKFNGWNTVSWTSEDVIRTEYANMTDLVAPIRADVEKQLGVSINDLSIELERQKSANKLMSDAATLASRSYNAQLMNLRKSLELDYSEQIKDLQKKLDDALANKLDEEVEAARVEELAQLKQQIFELQNPVKDLIKLGWFKQMVYNWLQVDLIATTVAKAVVERDKERKEYYLKTSNIRSILYYLPSWLHKYAGLSKKNRGY